jgi:hypothetical protein
VRGYRFAVARVLVAALAALLVVPAAAAAPAPVRTVAQAPGPIVAFDQDGPWLAWVEGGHARCRWQVRLANFRTGEVRTVNRRGGVTCAAGVTARLAVAGGRVVWSVWRRGSGMTIEETWVYSAGWSAPEQRLARLVLDEPVGGTVVGDLAGDGSTLVWSRVETSIPPDCDPYAGCEPEAFGVAGGVEGLAGAGAALFLAAAAGRVAVVAAEPVTPYLDAPRPRREVEIRSARTGELLLAVRTRTPIADVALSRDLLAVRSPAGAVDLYEADTGALLESDQLLGGLRTPDPLSLWGQRFVFGFGGGGRQIYLIDVGVGLTRLVTDAAARPLGLSIEGLRIAWAENRGSRGRIRAVVLRPNDFGT